MLPDGTPPQKAARRMLANTPTELLLQIAEGDSQAFDALFGMVYGELRTIARKHLAGSILGNQMSSSDLVHETYVRLIDSKHHNWKNRTHFFALGSKVMRQILVDRARRNLAAKRGGKDKQEPIELDRISADDDEHILSVNEALAKLTEIDSLQARIVEMRFFGGLKVEEVAESLGKSKRWVEAEWTMIRAWLRSELSQT